MITLKNIADQCILVFVSEGGGMAHICRTKKIQKMTPVLDLLKS